MRKSSRNCCWLRAKITLRKYKPKIAGYNVQHTVRRKSSTYRCAIMVPRLQPNEPYYEMKYHARLSLLLVGFNTCQEPDIYQIAVPGVTRHVFARHRISVWSGTHQWRQFYLLGEKRKPLAYPPAPDLFWEPFTNGNFSCWSTSCR